MRGMEKMMGERRLKRWLWWVTKRVRKRVSKEKEREGGEKEEKPAWRNNTLLLM